MSSEKNDLLTLPALHFLWKRVRHELEIYLIVRIEQICPQIMLVEVLQSVSTMIVDLKRAQFESRRRPV